MTRRLSVAVALGFAMATRTADAQTPPTPPKQAVVETTAGAFVIDLAPEDAPHQTAYFIKLALEGGYEGTIFHRVVKYGMVQGGDPLSRDPAKRAQYGTGGLNVVQAETRASRMTRGSVAAVTITLEFLVDKAPNTIRQFMRLAAAGVFNGTAFHRVAPGFVIQTGALSSRLAPLTEKQQKLVHNLPPEFNDTRHVKGIVSMARADAPDSATTSFFLCTGTSTTLDGQYTAFARVVDGMSAVEAIEASPRDGETPRTRVDLRSVSIQKQ
jgi:peptidyl-prolyl cis-trans isomerase B (cyclophilin B)